MRTFGLGSVARSVPINNTVSGFMCKPRVLEPLNVQSILEKIKNANSTPFATADKVRLFRNDFSRLLFFNEAELLSARQKLMMKLAKGDLKNQRSIANSNGIVSAVPFATLQPPPLLPFPRVQLPLWQSSSTDADYWNLAVPSAPTLSSYIALIEEATSLPSSSSSSSSSASSVGMLCASYNELRFVLTNAHRQVLFGPLTSQRLSANSSGSSNHDTSKNGNFYADFWSKLCCELQSSDTTKKLIDSASVLWFKSEGHIGEDLHALCCSENSSSFSRLLRDDERWARMHSHRHSKKAMTDLDCLLRDCYYGELKIFF